MPPVTEEQLVQQQYAQTAEGYRKFLKFGYSLDLPDSAIEPFVDMLERLKLSGEYPRWVTSFVASYQMIHDQPVVQEYPLVAAPTLFIMGANDHNAPGRAFAPPELAKQMGFNVANAQAIAARMPNAKVLVFDGVGHIPHKERPSPFVQAVEEFLDAPQPRSGNDEIQTRAATVEGRSEFAAAAYPASPTPSSPRRLAHDPAQAPQARRASQSERPPRQVRARLGLSLTLTNGVWPLRARPPCLTRRRYANPTRRFTSQPTGDPSILKPILRERPHRPARQKHKPRPRLAEPVKRRRLFKKCGLSQRYSHSASLPNFQSRPQRC